MPAVPSAVAIDVAIVGGGPAASAAALTLARLGATSWIIERRDDSGAKPGESLPPSAWPLLGQLGIGDGLAADGHLPCHGNRSVWGGDEPDEQPFLFSPYGQGWHLDRRRFERRLIERVLAAGVTRLTRTSVKEVGRVSHGWRLTLDGPLGTAEVHARFLIDATGRASALARRLDAGDGPRRTSHRLAYRLYEQPLMASVWFLETNDAEDRDSFTLVESARNGWWYSAFLPAGLLTVVFMTDPWSDGQEPPLEPPIHTRRRLAACCDRVVSAMQVDAGGSRLDRVAGHGWVAIGDAAAAWDPLSSYGLTAALATGIRAAEGIVRGDLAPYERDLETMWNAYRAMRRDYYAMEQRWPDAPFWRNQSESIALTTSRHPERGGREGVSEGSQVEG